MKFAKGFTLIEILMVVALIGILAAIAIPAYGNYVIRGKLVDASTQLSDARIKLEQFFQDNRTYVGGTLPAATKYFTFGWDPLKPTTQTTYRAVASSKANQGLGAAGDYQYTIDETNSKVTVKFAGVALNQVAPATCWIMKKGDTC
jgi:type IV pilus assembly protein PilE